MNLTAIMELYVFVLAAFVGFQVITRVPPLLHTPLMSVTNAICGISLVGAIVAAGAEHPLLSTVLGFGAVVCATINVVGGFVISERMLKMFQPTHPKSAVAKSNVAAEPAALRDRAAGQQNEEKRS